MFLCCLVQPTPVILPFQKKVLLGIKRVMLRAPSHVLRFARTSLLRAAGRGIERAPLEEIVVGFRKHGFVCEETRAVPELNLQAFQFRHVASGGLYVHLDSADTNNAFTIGFGTPATSDRGTTHVLEHTVLVRQPVFSRAGPVLHMLRRSFATFMNAMTGADYTLYPFSTTNVKDFSNLLGVYLDANVCSATAVGGLSPRRASTGSSTPAHLLPLRQRGPLHRSSPAQDAIKGTEVVAHNGVVYNEMRGCAQEPARHFMHQALENLSPRNALPVRVWRRPE